mgnify:CR=1 FL=1
MDNAFVANWFKWDHRMPLPWHRPLNKLLRYTRLNMQVVPRSFRWGMASIEARMNLFHLASQCAAYRVPGAFVEIGCNAGESSVVLQHIVNTLAPEREVHYFDSFEGTPPPTGPDAALGVYGTGDMSASLFAFHDTFRRAGMPSPPHVHKGWFEDTIPRFLPDRIAFALLDGDLYSSTKHVLPHLYARMAPGAVCMFGVYYDEAVLSRPHTIPQYKSPGVKVATDEFFADKAEKVSVLYAGEYSNGYFRKHQNGR